MNRKKKVQNVGKSGGGMNRSPKTDTEQLEGELIALNKELDFQGEEREKRSAELVIANQEKRKQAIELSKAKLEMKVSKKREKKSGADLTMAQDEILLQKKDKKARAAELLIANKELVFQKKEKRARAAELAIAKKELVFQEKEKKKRAMELATANKRLTAANKKKLKYAAELRSARMKLQKKEEQCRLVIEASPNAMLLIDKNGIITFINRQSEALFGYEQGELVGCNLEICIPKISLLIEEENLFARKKNGSVMLIEVSLTPIEATQGPVILICANDITGKETHETIKSRQLELEAKCKEAEEFVYLTSHDLQEPLRTVSNYMQLFEKNYLEILDENALHYINTIHSATKRMDILVKSIMSYSRLGNGNKKFVNVDCRKIVNEVISDLGALIKMTNAIIEISEMPELNVYEMEFRQLFQNLITNAIKFCKKDCSPIITICSEKLNDKWKFSVGDNGIGISSAHFKRVFDIFQRINPATEYEGHGIGLANCKKIVQLHQGEIWLESVMGQGTKFHFTIPV